MLDAENVRMNDVPGWVENFQRFGEFLADNPTGPELKRRRTHAKFIADLGTELAVAAHSAEITLDDMRDWTLNQSQHDVPNMRSLGFYREVVHVKLCDPNLQWEQNDLIDMMFLATAAGYCDHVAAERSTARTSATRREPCVEMFAFTAPSSSSWHRSTCLPHSRRIERAAYSERLLAT